MRAAQAFSVADVRSKQLLRKLKCKSSTFGRKALCAALKAAHEALVARDYERLPSTKSGGLPTPRSKSALADVQFVVAAYDALHETPPEILQSMHVG